MSIRTKQKKYALEKALISMDPYQIEAAMALPPLNNTSTTTTTATNHNKNKNNSINNNRYKESLQDANGFEWGSVLSALLDASDAALAGDAIQCYKSQSTLHSSLNHIFSSSPGNILVPALHAACRNTHRCAIQADHAAAASGGRNDRTRLQGAVTLLQESFSKTLNDRRELSDTGGGDGMGVDGYSVDGSKKVGVLYIVNWLFAMYFRLNTLRLCKNLLRPVESRQLHQKGTMGDMVTYRYYVGRLNMFEDKFAAAEENLQFALTHCHVNAKANKKRILNYLIPVKLLRGRLPTEQLLQKYSLTEFKPIIQGIQNGDLRTFNDGLTRNQDLFIRRGTYLLLEKCKTVCYRNLFKRIYLIFGKPQIHLDHVVRSLDWLGVKRMDLDEVECILANLIFSGKVRGYISHEKRILVLSKKDPFPTSVIIPK